MKGKLLMLGIAATGGYIAGARAGQERYESIRGAAAKVGLKLPAAGSEVGSRQDGMSSDSPYGTSSPGPSPDAAGATYGFADSPTGPTADLHSADTHPGRAEDAMTQVRDDAVSLADKVQASGSGPHAAP